jgi:ribosomal protein S18 acetylase RimI-like enzyme
MLVRTAEKSDLEAVADLLYSSGIELYDYLFETPSHSAKDFIRYEFLSGKGICGFKNVFVICDHNEVVGTACYYDIKGYTTTSNGTLSNVMSFYKPVEIVAIIFRLIKVLKLMEKPKSGEIYLSNFAVLPRKQGVGIGSEFIRNSIIKYKDKGFSIIGLDVEEENIRALKLYEKLGFVRMERKSIKMKYIKDGRFVGIKMDLQIKKS